MNPFTGTVSTAPLDVAAPFGGSGGMGAISLFLLVLPAVVIAVTAAVIIRLVRKKKNSGGQNTGSEKNEQ